MCRALRTAPLLLLVLAGCTKDGGTPAYIRLGEPVVISADGTDTLPSRITDLWVYANDRGVGVWEPGRRVPLLVDGASTVKLIAGIRRSGITDERIQYPFYGTCVLSAATLPTKEVTVSPVFKYYSDVVFWTEHFENAGILFDVSGSAGLTVIDNPDSVLEGLSARSIHLDPNHSNIRCISNQDAFSIAAGQQAFLEIDYRSDTRFLVGVRYLLGGIQQDVPYIYVSPTAENGAMPWRHIYVDLGTPWNTIGAYDKRFYIQAALENGATSGFIVLDNINVVHR